MHENRVHGIHMQRRSLGRLPFGSLALCTSAVLLVAGAAQGSGLSPCPLHSHGTGATEGPLDSPASAEDGAHTGLYLPGCDCGVTCMEARTVLPLPGAGEDRARQILVPRETYPVRWGLLRVVPRAPIPFFLPPRTGPPPVAARAGLPV